MKYVHIFALKDDIFPVLQLVESKGPIKYHRAGVFFENEIECFNAAADIPMLGIAAANSSTCCDRFLISARELEINFRPIQVRNVGLKLGVDQLWNADTVVLNAGGYWQEEVLLSGYVSTVSDTGPAQTLMKRFHSAIKKTFEKINIYHVGPNAARLLDSGKRLTDAVQCPSERDLSR